jgi:hypothetical protein
MFLTAARPIPPIIEATHNSDVIRSHFPQVACFITFLLTFRFLAVCSLAAVLSKRRFFDLCSTVRLLSFLVNQPDLQMQTKTRCHGRLSAEATRFFIPEKLS